jgi:hypothetical protein
MGSVSFTSLTVCLCHSGGLYIALWVKDGDLISGFQEDYLTQRLVPEKQHKHMEAA